MRGKVVKSIFLFLLISFLVACSSEQTKQEDEQGNTTEKNEIVIAVNENFITMDPHNTGDRNSNAVQNAMLESLITEEDGEIVPLLAENFSANDDATQFTFNLRQGVTFHDGTPFNAESVKVNFERIMDPDNSLRLYNRGFNNIKSIETPDDYTVIVTLNTPNSSMLPKFVPAKIVSPKALESGDITQHPVGTGPYKFVEWVQGDHLTIDLNKEYWADTATVERITYKPVPENGARVAMLKTGEADFIFPLPTQNINELENHEGVVVDKVKSTIARYVSLNTMKEPFNDKRVRQALNYAIDKDAYINVVMAGLATPLDSPLPSEMRYYQSQSLYEHNIEKAKDLLKEAGYDNGFEVDIWGNTNSDTLKGMQFVQQQLSQIGVKVNIVSMEEGTLSDKIYGGATPEEAEVQMWYVSWGTAPTDTDNAIKPILGGMSFPPTGANSAYYANDEVDTWLVRANEITNNDEQRELYANIQSTIYDDAPWIFLASDENIYGKRDRLEGVFVTPSGRIDVRNAKLK